MTGFPEYDSHCSRFQRKVQIHVINRVNPERGTHHVGEGDAEEGAREAGLQPDYNLNQNGCWAPHNERITVVLAAR